MKEVGDLFFEQVYSKMLIRYTSGWFELVLLMAVSAARESETITVGGRRRDGWERICCNVR